MTTIRVGAMVQDQEILTGERDVTSYHRDLYWAVSKGEGRDYRVGRVVCDRTGEPIYLADFSTACHFDNLDDAIISYRKIVGRE